VHQQLSSFPGNLSNMLSNATIRHCSRLAGRDCVELPEPATDGPGKCRGMPRGTSPSDDARVTKVILLEELNSLPVLSWFAPRRT